MDEKASFDQEKTKIEIPTSHSDEDEAPSTIIDTMCGSGENRIMFRLFCSKKKLLTHVTFFKENRGVDTQYFGKPLIKTNI